MVRSARSMGCPQCVQISLVIFAVFTASGFRVHRKIPQRIVLNYRMIDPRLHTLRMVREHGTVTAAAQALHLTPSTVSQQLRQLANELDVRLLEQIGRRVQLTAAAHTLLRHADLLAAQAERARTELAAHRDGIAGVLRIGSSPTATAVVAPAAARLRAVHPRLTVELCSDESGLCLDLLLAGDIDIAVVFPTVDTPPPDDLRFEQWPLLDDPQDLLVPAGHSFAARTSIALAEAAGEVWIGAPDRVAHQQFLLAACAAAGFTPHVGHRAIDWVGISAMIAQGFGVSLVPRLTHLPGDLAVVRVPLHGEPRPFRRHNICVRRGSGDHPLIGIGLAAVWEVCRERPGVVVFDG